MEFFPSNWHMPQYPLALLMFALSCFFFMWSTYSFAAGLVLHGKTMVVATNTSFSDITYHFRIKVSIWGGSLSFAYMMAYIFFK